MGDIVYVHAGSKEQATLLAHKLGVKESAAHFVVDVYDIYGLERGTTIYFVGTYWEHPNHRDIVRCAQSHGLEVVFEDRCFGFGMKPTKEHK